MLVSDKAFEEMLYSKQLPKIKIFLIPCLIISFTKSKWASRLKLRCFSELTSDTSSQARSIKQSY